MYHHEYNVIVWYALEVCIIWLAVWSLTPFSTIFQLYRGGQFYWWRKPGVSGENHWPVASRWQTLSHNVVHLALIEIMLYRIHLTSLTEFELRTFVVIGTDWTISCKSDYHKIMSTTVLTIVKFLSFCLLAYHNHMVKWMDNISYCYFQKLIPVSSIHLIVWMTLFNVFTLRQPH